MTYQVSVLGHVSNVMYKFYLKKQTLNPFLKKWLVIPISNVPLLQQYILQSEHCCRSQVLWLGDIDYYLSPVVVCRVPSSTLLVEVKPGTATMEIIVGVPQEIGN